MEQKLMYDLHAEHREWLNKLSFYKDEVKIMRDRLTEIANKNTDKEMLSYVDHFENQLKVQAEQMDIIRHDIKQHENKIEASINANPTAVDHRKSDDHVTMREKVETFEKIFNDLRKEMISFAAKWM